MTLREIALVLLGMNLGAWLMWAIIARAALKEDEGE